MLSVIAAMSSGPCCSLAFRRRGQVENLAFVSLLIDNRVRDLSRLTARLRCHEPMAAAFDQVFAQLGV
jgi:hypothetical protein